MMVELGPSLVRGFALSALLALAAAEVGCGGKPTEAATAESPCQAKTIPVGHWSGEWESYPLSNPDFIRSGSIDLVVAESGKLNGETEEETRDVGALSGVAKPGGEFEGEYSVTRDGAAKKYTLKGSFTCEGGGLTGMATVGAGDQKGTLKFQLAPAR